MSVISRFASAQEMHVGIFQVSDMRSIASQTVFDNDEFQFGVKCANAF